MTSETHVAAERARAGYAEGKALLQGGRPDAAVAPLTAALAAARSGAEVSLAADIALALAVAHRRRGDLRAAAAAYARVAAERPLSGEAWLNLGAAHADAGDLERGAEALGRSAALDPASPHAPRALARVLNALGRGGDAQGVREATLARRPDDPDLLRSLARAWSLQGRPDGCAAVLRRALAAAPDDRELRLNLAEALRDDGLTDEALDLLRALVSAQPDDGLARLRLCMTHLAPLYSEDGEVDRRRANYADALANLAAWAEARPGALADAVGASQPFHLPYQGRDDRGLQVVYGGLVGRAMRACVEAPPLPPPPQPGEPIRVGFVSGFFRAHANWRMPVEGWVRGLDRRRFQLFGYHTGARTDAVTADAATLFARFVQGPLSTVDWCAEIARDAPHVLIHPEVGMDPSSARLAALRLAPVQAVGWGHPVTSGLPTMDAFLSSDAMEPADGQDAYSERLVRLPGLSTSLFRPGPRPEPSPRAALGWPEEAVVLWCGQSPYKYLPRTLDLLAQVAARAPDALFVFAAYPGSDRLTRVFRDNLHAAFGRRASGAAARVIVAPRMEPLAFDAAMAAADMVLDSVGWSGCNTLATALDAGLPVVTTPGRFMRGRHGAALLGRLGASAWVCRDEAAYVDLAARLALEPDLRARFAGEIRGARDRLYAVDAEADAALERFLAESVTTSPSAAAS